MMAALRNKVGGDFLAARVLEIRQEHDLSQIAFGKKVGLSQQAVSKIERGKTVHPRNVEQIARFAGCSISELIDPGAPAPLTGQETILLRQFRRLTDWNRSKVLRLIEYELTMQGNREQSSAMTAQQNAVHDAMEDYLGEMEASVDGDN